MQPLTVTQLVDAINDELAALDQVVVEGEVGEFKIIHGKWVTFQIKDEKSSVGCFMTLWQYKTQIEDGMLVRAQGRPSLRNKGFFSFVVTNVQPAGEGSLKRAFELLKQKLTAEGLFDPARKRTLPRFPQHIALITSRDAAAYSDFLKVLQARYGGLTISFIHTQVQGTDAPRQLISALAYANTELADLDVIVMVRGGGSLEDLQAFNDETVIRAVAASRTPIMVGIGHERDITLAELAADVRASTPSNAAELIIRSRDEIALSLQQMRFALSSAVAAQMQQHQNAIARDVTILRMRPQEVQHRLQRRIESLAAVRQRIAYAVASQGEAVTRHTLALRQQARETLSHQSQHTQQLVRVLRTLSPEYTLQRGYSITRTAGGKVVRSAGQLPQGKIFTVTLVDGSVDATAGKAAQQKGFNF